MRFLLTLLALVLPMAAQETMIREVFDVKTDTHVEVLALFSQPARSGYFPVRVKIANNLETDRSVELRFKSTVNYDEKILTRSTFSIWAGAGKTVTRDIVVPLSSCPNNYSVNATIELEMSGSLGRASNTLQSNRQQHSPEVLLSEALFTPNASVLDALTVKRSSTRYGSGKFAAKFDPKQLPSDWLAFSGYDSLLMTDNDWVNVPAGARNAILSWVNLGGQLIIHSIGSASHASLGIPEDPGYGSVKILPQGSDLKVDEEATLDAVEKDNPVRLRTTSILSDFNSSWALQKHYGKQAFHYGIFIVVLIIFGILVGPVNLFVLAKSGSRHRLFITTPIISLAASLVLMVLIIWQDGFGGNGMRRVLMEVRPDAGQNAAFLHQEQFSRTGILASSKFTVDPACFFTAVPIDRSRWSRYTDEYSTSASFTLKPNAGKLEAGGDWWQSRSEHGHALSAVIPTRGRIERTGSPDTMVSSFDFPIQTLYFLDTNNEWHRAQSIETGKAFRLTPVDATMAEPEIAKEAAAFATRNRGMLERAKNRKGHFIAITSNAPGINTLPGIQWKETRTVITGPVK